MDKYRAVKSILNSIKGYDIGRLRIMEVCGTHTQAAAQSGLRSLLPDNISLLSGPGCPVCVTAESCIDAAIEMLDKHNVILATFGDMLRVKGTTESISEQFGKRKNIVVVYSSLDCLELARKHPGEQVVFFGAGFETTAPSIALAVKLAFENRLQNLTFLTALKLMPPVLHSILKQEQREIHGIICPGHVAVVKGAGYFRFITEEYGIPAAVCGFDPLDIALGIQYLSAQYSVKADPGFANLYETCVREEGNTAAEKVLQEVFEVDGVSWRGIGHIKDSALVLRQSYSSYNALERFEMKLKDTALNKQCNCRDILLGNKVPSECSLFGKACTPLKPAGPCMVSGEGSCAAYYRFTKRG